MPVCVKCNTINLLGGKECKKCGQALIVDEGMRCTRCNMINGPFAKMCKKCGEILKKGFVVNKYIPPKQSNIHTNNSIDYPSIQDNYMFKAFVDTMNQFNYNYELLQNTEKGFYYRIGEKRIILIPSLDGNSLNIEHLNKELTLTRRDEKFIPVLLVNWLYNNLIEPMSIIDKVKKLLNDPINSTQYSLTQNEDIILSIVSENLIKLKFKEFEATKIEPCCPNMPYNEFEKIIQNYITLSENKTLIQYIKEIESSTDEYMMVIEDVTDRGCKIQFNSPTNVISSILLTDSVAYTEVRTFINKIKFMEVFIP
ncbi:hypothetical protein [Priestia aryabhattai]|uniref:hypothetical protein n=1 Tax=Priestia aryabhattai TaxID=412384 RepID=UPI0023B0FAF1|nr:hypothetical protein [Priestia aryabhattai]MDE8674697.1 hypothetical protein [Priestia aryabhattai]